MEATSARRQRPDVNANSDDLVDSRCKLTNFLIWR
jgi:hypothetical protein